MMSLPDPKVDYAFKYIFGREATMPILIAMLNDVLNLPLGELIVSIELLNPFNPKESVDDKLSILDIKARDQLGRCFNIEMQIRGFDAYIKRTVYYWANLYRSQVHEGEGYHVLMPTISITFINDVLFSHDEKDKDYHHCFRLLEVKHRFPLTDDVEFHVFELPKFKKTIAELANGVDIWLYFLRHAQMMEVGTLPETVRQPMLVRAMEELEMLSQADLERHQYESRRIAQMDEKARITEADAKGFAKGERSGFMKGEQIGTVRGLKMGSIQLGQESLGIPVASAEYLSKLSLDELTRMADSLKAQLHELKNR